MKDEFKNTPRPEAPQHQQGISRREFAGVAGAAVLTAAGGVLGAGATAGAADASTSPQTADAPSATQSTAPVTAELPIPSEVAPPPTTEYECDVLVIGGGFAGLMAAVTAKEAGQAVVLMDKGRPGYSGLSPFVSSHRWFDPEMGDSADYVRTQAIRGAQYIGNQNWTEVWIKESKGVYEKLKELGMLDRYDRAVDKGYWDNLDYVGYHESIAQHDRHARVKKILDEKGVAVCEHTMVTNVIKQGGKVVGAIGFHVPSGAIVTCHAKAVIMCMGGGVYKPAGWPTSGISFDGIAIGYDLGLPVIGQEFEDFHRSDSNEPANAFVPNSWTYLENIWLTGGDWTKEAAQNASASSGSTIEKVRVALEGMEPWDGSKVEEGKNLAGTKSGRADDVRTGKRNSTIPKGDAWGCATGFCTHLTNGVFCGLEDTVGFTGLAGLYVAGDGISGGAISGAAYAGGRGFTSNFVSLQGKRAAEAASKYAKTIRLEKIDGATIAGVRDGITAPMKLKKGFSANWALDCLHGTMAQACTLVIKTRECLQAALTQVSYMRDKVIPKLQAVNSHDLRLCHEMKNKVLEAEMKLRASLAREESRGMHYRADFPYRDDRNFLCYVALQKGPNGEMTVSKIDVKDEWKGDLTEDYASRYSNSFFPGEAEALKLPVEGKPRSRG